MEPRGDWGHHAWGQSTFAAWTTGYELWAGRGDSTPPAGRRPHRAGGRTAALRARSEAIRDIKSKTVHTRAQIRGDQGHHFGRRSVFAQIRGDQGHHFGRRVRVCTNPRRSGPSGRKTGPCLHKSEAIRAITSEDGSVLAQIRGDQGHRVGRRYVFAQSEVIRAIGSEGGMCLHNPR